VEYLEKLKNFFHPHVVSAGLLGLPGGLLFVLIMATSQVWLSESGIDKTTIGLLALACLPNALKFTWAPFLDHVRLPILAKRFGHRRSWALLLQACLMVSLVGLGSIEPQNDLLTMAFFMVLVSFFGASQDVVVDAFRIELLHKKHHVAGVAINVFGYRIGAIIGGAGALYLAAYFGWFWTYVFMAICVGISSMAILFNAEPKSILTDAMKERQERALNYLNQRGRSRGLSTRIMVWCYGAFLGPLTDFSKRKGWLWIFLFVLIFRLGDNLINNMANVFYLSIGFSKIDIANVTKFFGVFATIVGGFMGGLALKKIGQMRALLFCSILHLISNYMMIVLAQVGYNLEIFYLAIALENVTGGMVIIAFTSYLLLLCNRSYTGTQYALLSSLWYLGTPLASIGGWLADQVNDWITFFSIAMAAALPGIFILLWITYKYPQVMLHDIDERRAA
jgi:MFS transporter, PAT family, beta-lactamase induction signal transducer AmpG